MLFPTLESIELVAYRGLRDLKLDHLAPVTLLFGPNNSGKTSILEAVALFCQPLDLREWFNVVKRRDPDRIDESRRIGLRWCFPQALAPKPGDDEGEDSLFHGEVEIRGGGTFSAKQLNVAYREFFAEASDDDASRHGSKLIQPNSGPAFYRGGELTAHVRSVPNDQIESETLRFTEYAPALVGGSPRLPRLRVGFVTPSSYQSGERIVRLIHGARSRSQMSDLVDVLRCFDSAVEDVEIGSSLGRRPAVFVRHARLGYAPLSVFGDGMRRAVYILASLCAVQGGVLLLDEVETSIHFSALQDVAASVVHAAAKLNVQLFVATHSLDAIDAFLAVDCPPDRIIGYRLPAKDSKERLATFPGKALHELRYEGGKEIR